MRSFALFAPANPKTCDWLSSQTATKSSLRFLVSPMKIRAWSISCGRLGPHASCVHPVSGNLVHAGSVRSQGSSPMSGALATHFHSQWRAAGSLRLGGEYGYSAFTTKTLRHKEPPRLFDRGLAPA